jgi:hypothetical protein
VEEFVIENRLHIINEESRLTTFESNGGNSNVDLTLTDNKLVTLVKEWQCTEQESFSDHRIITFRIEAHRSATRKYIHTPWDKIRNKRGGIQEVRYKFYCGNQTNFALAGSRSLDDDLCTAIALEKDIEITTEKYQGSMVAACRKSIQVRKGG